MLISIYRYNPEKDLKPYMQDFTVNPDDFPGVMLLDAIIHIKNTMDDSLTVRRSCGEGVCGSDGMNINGRNGLACITPLSDLGQKITLRPLPGMPIIRDLVVDLSQFYEQYRKARPYLENSFPPPAKEYLQSPKERSKLDGLYECILCACCTSGCPSYWWNPDKFLGPAAALQAARFVLDSRDTATQERLSDLEGAYPIFRCRGIMVCTNVCPKGLNPAKAISDVKHIMIDQAT